MRGKGGGKDSTIVLAGITPAYAGKSYRRISADPIHQDHPRLCGEKLLVYTPKTPYVGSPPPMRGKDVAAYAKKYKSRITPAYAGKSGAMHRDRWHCWDHPRLCGEKPANPRLTFLTPGSPPPMRGKELFPVVSVRRLRITPAYAGKRDVSRMSFPMYEDHPRLCGEKVYSMASVE